MTGMQTPAPPAAVPSLLDARERAIRLLTDRYAEGAFEETELDVRIARLHEARDAAGVEAVVHDLRDASHPTGRDMPLAAPPRLAPVAAPDERRLLCVMSEARRSGWWPMPRLVRVRAVMGNLRLDLRDAPILDELTIDVRAIMSSVVLIVPPGLSVRFELFATLGNAGSQAPDLGPAAAPRILVDGSAFMSEVRVIVRERGR
jgi:hypothetical protein